jgi:hypothetical protein
MREDIIWFWGRPSTTELWQDLREVTRTIRSDWDPGTPELQNAWANGDKTLFYPYARPSGGQL